MRRTPTCPLRLPSAMSAALPRKRRTAPQASISKITEDSKPVRSVFVLWIHSSNFTFLLADERTAVRSKHTQILLAFRRARLCLFSIPGEYAPFLRQPTCDGFVQYSDLAGHVVRVWLGQDDDGPSRHLPGWSPSSYIGLEADVEKRDAVVAAFRVRIHTPCPSCSMVHTR